MNKIVAFSAKKQGGKNTAFNFLLGIVILRLSVTQGRMEIRPDGSLWLSDMWGDEAFQGVLNIDRNTDAMKNFREEYIYPFIRNYSFADLLKHDVCMKILGLTWEQCYGTDEQKNSLTNLKWENMPGVITCPELWDHMHPDGESEYGLTYHAAGPITAREVMQFVGTEIFRRMYGNVWAEGTIKEIQSYKSGLDGPSKLSVITDCRFPNEVEAVQKAGGKVIRFTREVDGDDKHHSENALNKDKFDWDRFDAVIDNQDMSISDQNGEVYKTLYNWGYCDGIGLPESVES